MSVKPLSRLVLFHLPGRGELRIVRCVVRPQSRVPCNIAKEISNAPYQQNRSNFAFGAEYREIRLQPSDRKSAVDCNQDGEIIEIPDCVVHVVRASRLCRAEEYVAEYARGIECYECKHGACRRSTQQ